MDVTGAASCHVTFTLQQAWQSRHQMATSEAMRCDTTQEESSHCFALMSGCARQWMLLKTACLYWNDGTWYTSRRMTEQNGDS
jgi:hypothetical protein